MLCGEGLNLSPALLQTEYRFEKAWTKQTYSRNPAFNTPKLVC